MAGEIFFKSGSKSSITTEAPLTPSYKAGTVYFAIDDDNNGFIYLDYDNKRIPMTSVAEKASNDSADHSIVNYYVHSITSATNTLTYKNGNGDQLGTASIINSVSNAWTNGTTAGPTITTTVNGVSGSAVAIPSAGASTSGVVTTGAQTFAGAKTFSSKIIGNLQGNADTATSATNDSSSHKIADWYVHSIAHSNNTLVYKDGDGDQLGSFAIPGAFFVKGTQTASTNAWTGALPSGVTQYYEGLSIAYFLPFAGTSSAATLNLGGLGAKPVILGENATGSTTTHYAAKNVIWMTYLIDSSVNSGNGYWKVSAHRNSTYYYTTAYCGTSAGTAAKVGSVSYYTLQPGYIPVMFIYDNTAQSALTLNINSTGAKPLYINGVASSSSNYTIKRGVYIVRYDGTNYYLRTDDIIPGKIERAIADGNGNEILTTYANSLTLSGNTLTLKNKNNDTLSSVTIAASDTKVNVTLGTTSKAYLLATTTAPTATAAGVTSIADTGVYLGTTAGELVATKFTGDLNGNAATATLAAKATGDGNGNPILTTYASSLSGSGTTLTLKNKNGDTLSTVTTQDTKNTAGSSQDTSKLYLVGAKSQAASAQTYSSSKVYVTDGTLTAPTFAGDLTGNAATATLAAKATGDANGNPIITTYASSLTASGNSLILKNKNGDTLSTVTVAASDTKVNVTLDTTSKAYILGTTTAPTATATGVTSIADTGVYLGTTAGELVATTFTGDLAGNAATATLATKATGDANGNPILTTYASSLSVSGRTLTLKNKNGDTLSTVTTQDNDTKNTAGSTNSTSKLFLIGATSQAANPQTYSSSKVYVTDGTVTATTFSGDLSGNATSATTATKATYDSGNNEIESTYIKSISYSGNSTTNAAGTAITAGSAGLVTMLKGDDTPSKIDIPAATASVAGLVNNGAQTWAGTKTFSTGVTISSGTSTKAVFNYSDIQAGTSDSARPVWFAWAGQNGTPVIDTDFTYNPSSNTLKATNFDGLATKATGDAQGNPIVSTYANSLTLSGSTLTLKAKNGDNLSQVTIAASDTKVNVTLGTTSKAYILGTTTTPTSTATGVTSIADTGVYLGTTAGQLVATTFKGDLDGNAATATLATKATGDGNGNEIISKYASSLSASGTTLTLKAKNGDTLSTVTTQDTKNTAGSSQKATKIYIIGAESQAASAQTYSSGKVYITDGTVTATTFSGALSGNADTATLAAKATGDANGNPILSNYASELTVSGRTLTLKAKNGDTLSTVTTQDNDTKNTAGSTNSTSKLFLIGATSQAANPQTYSSSKVYVTDGTLTATTFSGNLSGNATTATSATSATNDSGSHKILDWYVHSISFDSSTSKLTYTDGDGDPTDVLLPFLLLTGGNVTGPVSFGDAVSIDTLTVGSLVSTGVATFTNGLIGNLTGNITGNAATATNAFNDSQGNLITSNYASSLTSSGNILTLKAKNDDTLSTPKIVNSIGHTWGGGTTAGPTLYITVNGQSSTASAIPSASASASGIVTTGDQSFAGIKTFTGNDVVISKTGPDPASTPVTFANRTSYPSLTFKDDSQYGSFIMTRYDSVFKPGVTLYFRSDQTYANFIASYLKAEEGLYAKYANTLITGGSKTAAVTTSPYVPEKWTFNTTVSPANGDIITIETPGGGHDYGVFLSVKDGDYYPIVLNGTGRLTTHYPQGTLLTLIFDSDQSATSIFPLAGGTARTTVTGGAWRVLNYYDSGNPGDWNLRQYTIKAASAITAIHAIGGTDSGYKPIDTGNAFDIRYAVMYAGSDIAASGTGNNNFIHHYSINLRNSSNSNISFTAYKNVYIKGTISGTTFTPYSTTNPYVQDITASDDGYVYYYIGRAYSTSAMTFDTTGRDIFVYKNGAIRKYSGNAENANYVNLYEARGTTTNLNKAANYVGAGTMFHLIASSSTTTGKCSFDANVLQMNWDNNGGYDSQLAISTSGSRMQIRSQVSAGTAWREVVTTAAATQVGSGVIPVYISNTGAVTASTSTAGSAYVPVYLNAGTLTQCSNPSMLTNLGSTSAASVFQASPRPGITGVLGTANGGTGSSSFTALRAIYTESATKLSSSGHYMSSNKFAVNSTSEPSYNLYVNGSTYFNGNASHNGDIYQYSLNGQRWREHFYEATAGTSALGTGTQTFTVKGGRWGEVWYEYPRLTTTYATAGDATSTATTATSGGIYYWRQWSYNSSTADRLSYYENFYLPTVTKDRTGNASYEIFTSKSYTTLDGRYVNVSGDTMTGQLQKAPVAMSWVAGRNGALIRNTTATFTANNYNPIVSVKSINGSWEMGTYTTNNSLYFTYITDANFNSSTNTTTAQVEFRGSDNSVRASKVYGAVWNDYAEYRYTKEEIKPGRVVIETGFGDMKLSDRRLQPGANVTTDTFGFAIGETEINKTPIAVSGRVLVYPYESIDEFRKHIGGPVCSGPNGTVSIMSIQEERMYPSRIIGTVSEIPDYEEWGTENIKVNGRIWIRVR